MALDAEGTRLITADEASGRPRLCVLDAGAQELASLSMRGWPVRIALPSIDRLVVQYADGLLRIVDPAAPRVLAEHVADARALVCDPDAGRLVVARGRGLSASTSARDGSLVMIDLVSGLVVAEVPTGDDSLPRAISRDGAWIAATSASAGRTRLWPDRPRPPLRPLRTHFTPSLAAQSRVARAARGRSRAA
jgi:hypothetical protein